MILAREAEEFVASCPLQGPHVERIARGLDALIAEIDAAYALLAHLPTDRDFAAAVSDSPLAALLFARRRAPDVDTRVLLERSPRRHVADLLARSPERT